MHIWSYQWDLHDIYKIPAPIIVVSHLLVSHLSQRTKTLQLCRRKGPERGNWQGTQNWRNYWLQISNSRNVRDSWSNCFGSAVLRFRFLSQSIIKSSSFWMHREEKLEWEKQVSLHCLKEVLGAGGLLQCVTLDTNSLIRPFATVCQA